MCYNSRNATEIVIANSPPRQREESLSERLLVVRLGVADPPVLGSLLLSATQGAIRRRAANEIIDVTKEESKGTRLSRAPGVGAAKA